MTLSFAIKDDPTELLFGHGLAMDGKRSRSNSNGSSGRPSPPLNNTHPVPPDPNSASSSAASLFSGMGSAAAVASFWQQKILLAAATANPLLSRFSHHQNLLQPGWTPPSPPSQLPGPLSPALSNASSGSARGNTSAHHNNNNINDSNLNNNMVSNSGVCGNSETGGKFSIGSRKLHNPDDDQQYSRSQKRQKNARMSSATKPPEISHHFSGTQKQQPTARGKRFTCTICDKSFGYKHVLTNHQRTHTKEKPFECPVCHQKFSRDHHMKTHMRLHTGERPYSCSVCNRGFVQVANMRRHMRVHTGERPYSCKICSMKFSDSNQLKSHQLSHTTETVLQCNMCHKQFQHLINHKCISASVTPAVAPSSRLQKPLQPSSPSRPKWDDDVHAEGVKVPEVTESFTYEPCRNDTIVQRDKSRGKSRFKSSNLFGAFTSSLPVPSNSCHIPADLPEQTEPKDLSMSRGISLTRY